MENFIAQLKSWHEAGDHQQIADAVEKIPAKERGYEVCGLYARALNNLERFQEALDQLMAWEVEGQGDYKWHYRAGFSLYFLDRDAEAAQCFQRAIDLGDEDEQTKELLQNSLKYAAARLEQMKYTPAIYQEDELDCVSEHIVKYFGRSKNIYRELVSPDIHVDIAIIAPTTEHNYYTLVTIGMGALPMNVPEKLRGEGLDRAELLICLPPDWKLDDLSNEEWYWPLRWLKYLARLPISENSWLGWGHTIGHPEGESFAPNTQLSNILLLSPGGFDEESFACELPNGEIVNFYQMIPLYEEETQFKLKANVEMLLNFLDQDALEFVKIDRKNVCGGGK
ncbi:MAG: suppressor of fused domain protein [Helicobacteraceae bacterium]|jgi:hypothetical protein|nr:suppressor of fused domain protein [Helicobacteraceae bacterium]